MADVAEPSRRAVLALGSTGLVSGALVLAGCAPAGEAPSGSGPASTPPEGEPTLENPSESNAADEPPTGEDVAALADVPVGGSIAATIAGASALVAQPTAGQVVAFSAICTHQGCTVAAAGGELDCPCHGSKFDSATGAVINGPAQEPLRAIPVSISGDRIVAAS
ncbi:ubiquinol-cytochrome c reductase iron-sulfur subunit [Agromyces salentinus]|uniref:Cytochrome bc1 complex Rieske iron-sulfur subunit n=1 Tax=Agromyces salentinus TaxID=269421 RepID=A0ABN2MN64_9MICO|nr:Rieske (2Fe-2S) protein [Agromyces salentinus]